LPARNTLVQRLALYIDPERHNAERYRQGRTDDMMVPIVDRMLSRPEWDAMSRPPSELVA